MIDSDRRRTQDRGASSHQGGNFGVCSDMCIHSMFSFWILIFCKNNLNSEHLFFVNHFEKGSNAFIVNVFC